jgi:hypothetical protein
MASAARSNLPEVRGDAENHTRGTLNHRTGSTQSTGEWAFTAAALSVAQEVSCSDGFTAHGGLDLRGAHLGALVLDGATLDNPGGTALECQWSTVDRQVSCRYGFTARGQFGLYGASVGTRVDLRGGTFSEPGQLVVDFERLNASALYLLPKTRTGRPGRSQLRHGRHVPR